MDAEGRFEPKIYRTAEPFAHLLSLETLRALRYREFFSLLLIELDHHPDVDAGDNHFRQMIQIVSRTLRTQIRGTDLIGHLGQAIVILLLHADEKEIQAIAGRIQKQIQHFAFPVHLCGPSRKVTISIGAVCFPQNGVTESMLLTNARSGLEEAKRHGGNCYAIAGGRRKEIPRSKGESSQEGDQSEAVDI